MSIFYEIEFAKYILPYPINESILIIICVVYGYSE